MAARNTEQRSHDQSDSGHTGRSASGSGGSAGMQSSQGSPGTQSSQSGHGAHGAQQSEQSTRTDRQRQMPTSRETGRGSALARQGGSSSLTQGGNASPISFMRQFMDDVDELFSQFGIAPAAGTGVSRGRQNGGQGLQNLWMPEMEVFQRGNDLVIRADLPGVKRNDIDVEIDDGNLIIQGERQQEHEDNEQQQGFYQSERSYGSFFRSIPLPEGINPEQASASFDNGVLEITLPIPQQQQQRGKKVQVK